MSPSSWTLTPQQVIDSPQVTILVFHNVYPEGKQGGLEIIQHGERVATNGDLRMELTPGQWAPLPRVTGRSADAEGPEVRVQAAFTEPDLKYQVRVRTEGPSLRVTVDLEAPLPEAWAGKAGFNLELLPSALFGKAYAMDGQFGLFPHQANGPAQTQEAGTVTPGVMARGRQLLIAPDDRYKQIEILSPEQDLMLLDGRLASQNGWFIVRSTLPAGKTEKALEWVITPNRATDWQRQPQILISQVGYHPEQEKQALVELDPNTEDVQEVALLRVESDGRLNVVKAEKPERSGRCWYYDYALFDFSEVKERGLYQVEYGEQRTHPFLIAKDVYQEGVWQPTLETFLPVQMCHVRVEDINRVWHGACHLDDALQAPAKHVHFDGYQQYETLQTPYPEFGHIPGLDRGGWHDAGDYDLAAGSQAGTTYDLALIRETFELNSDQTSVDRAGRVVQLHRPDGTPDVIEQVIHGVENLLSGYHAAGHSFAGIIEGSLKQYVHLGDAATMTDNRIYDANLPEGVTDGERSGARDDRWAFTNHDTALEYQVAAALAASSRVLAGFEDALAAECLGTAKGIWEHEHSQEPELHPAAYVPRGPKATEVLAAVELLLATGEEAYARRLVELWPEIEERFAYLGWAAARALPKMQDEDFGKKMRQAAQEYQRRLKAEEDRTPFRLAMGEGWLKAAQADHDPFAEDYHPPIWGIGWNLQRFAVHHYYLVRAYPDLFERESVLRVLNYVLGWHPANNLSLVSGVGANSLTVAYGVNRAEWSYTPGGIASGPALLRPGIIELMDPWPYLWQQKEYVIGGASSYLFLVLAADDLLNRTGKAQDKEA